MILIVKQRSEPASSCTHTHTQESLGAIWALCTLLKALKGCEERLFKLSFLFDFRWKVELLFFLGSSPFCARFSPRSFTGSLTVGWISASTNHKREGLFLLCLQVCHFWLIRKFLWFLMWLKVEGETPVFHFLSSFYKVCLVKMMWYIQYISSLNKLLLWIFYFFYFLNFN